MLSLALALTLASSLVSAAGPAGNEDFAFTRSLVKKSLAPRTSTDSFSSSLSAITFTSGDKILLSPVSADHTRYTLDLTQGSFQSTGDYAPVTVIHVSPSSTCDTLASTLSTFEAVDDVWDASFMKGVILQSTAPGVNTEALSSCLSTYNTTLLAVNGASISKARRTVNLASFYSESETIPQGPYLAKVSTSGNRAYLTQVYRAYRDEMQAFTSPAIPDASGSSFTAISAQVTGMATQSIPVPSRLYTLNATTTAKPLTGMRFAVKDIYDLAGMQTGCGSRAYFNLYGPRNESAVAVQRLIDLGAIVVGKDKTSQFANGESGADWVDQKAPYNPRGDGYQDPQTSSAGSGSAVASYDWLDFAIGSDSGGSVRDPAAVGGTYGVRPSHGAISLTGVMPLSSPLDTAGFLVRDPHAFGVIAKAWYGDAFKSYPSFPKRLIVPDNYFPLASDAAPGAQAIYSKFIDNLSTLLSNVTIDTRSLPGMWNTTGLAKKYGQDFLTYTNETYPSLIGYYQYTYFGKPFIADYQAQYGGRSPFLDPQPEVRWGYGESSGEAKYNASLVQKEVVKEFVASFIGTNNQSCSDSLFIYPIQPGATSYINTYKSYPTPPFGFFNEVISPLAETPEIVIPLGQVAYNSTIDDFQEMLPVSVAIIAAVGCDYMLYDLVTALADAGYISSVKTGRTPF
ncbi:amidase signature enzyme [Pseudohyphozyma bogoriensis]|nr:amidase signature enzyme [Pseudohyphozyma bogoriensis]